MAVRALVLGCAGPALSADERSFFRDADPFGFILFRRNVESPEQLAALTSELRESVGRDVPILVDQEGGRVQRLRPPDWPKYPAARVYSTVFPDMPMRRREITRLAARLMAHDLRAVGITVNCLPVLDVPIPGSSDVIGDRAYATDADTVAVLGRSAAEGLMAGAVMPVMKHIPGHGRSTVDSHHDLPVVTTARATLNRVDFRPFATLADMPAAMTAHIVYTAIDDSGPATTSRRVIRSVIRGRIGFSGLLFSDDLSMQALSGTLGERARAAHDAGCDIALHCNGEMAEMIDVTGHVPVLAGKAKRRAEAALACTRHVPEPLDVDEARAALAEALATVPAS